MPTQEEIAYQMELLATYRQKLVHLLRMRAEGSVSAQLVEDFRHAREEIRRFEMSTPRFSIPAHHHT
ncbi:MAG TPA: hypothetical protein VGJ87_06880 [Roseiflexaceae bacterium]|jgi:hypothetical protein